MNGAGWKTGLLGSVFFLFWGLAAGGTAPADLGLICFAGAACGWQIASMRNFRSWSARLWKMRDGLLPLLFYLILDVAGFLRSGEFGMLWEKYRVTVLLLALMGAMLLSGRRETAFDAVFSGAGLASLAVVLVTLFRYFGGSSAPLEYLLRFSLRRDYNMYATALFIGWICCFFLLCGKERPGWALAGTALILPVLLLSGSRRVMLAVPVAAAAAAWRLISSGKGRLRRRTAAVLGCGMTVLAASLLLQSALMGLSSSPKAINRVSGGGSGSGQTAAAERYETIGHGSMLTKRRVIWGIALEELSDYSPAEWFFGRGGGENIRLYDRTGKPLDGVYPDRELRRGALSAHSALLADLLDGGILKAAALIWLLGACGWGCLKLLLREPERGLAVGLILGFTILSNLVSNRYGLLYDRAFLLFYPLLLLKPERGNPDESPNCNADHPASA